MTQPAATPEEMALALARQVAGKVFRQRALKVSGERFLLEMHHAKRCEQGDGDDYDAVQAALIAIRETSERAAKHCDGYAKQCEGREGFIDIAVEEIGLDLRRGDHLK